MQLKLTSIILFFFLVFNCCFSSFAQQPNPIKKIIVKVLDVNNGKPVENAEVTFKGLLFKKTKKTDNEGKAIYDVPLFGESQIINIEVKNTGSHKDYKTSVTLNKSQDNYDVITSLKPAYKKVSLTVLDDNGQPLSNAKVTVKASKDTREQTINTTSNGIATFNVPAVEGQAIIPVAVSKDGFETFNMNVDVNDSQQQLTTALKKLKTTALFDKDSNENSSNPNSNSNSNSGSNSNSSSGSNGVNSTQNTGNSSSNTAKPGADDNINIPQPVNEKPKVGPHTPKCDANPSVPPIKDIWKIPPEKEFSDYLIDECIKPITDFASALKTYLKEIKYFSAEFKSLSTANKNGLKDYDNAMKMIDKLSVLREKLGMFFATPYLYGIECVSKAILFYASADAYQLKESYDDAKAVNVEFGKSINDLKMKIKLKQDLSSHTFFSGTFWFNLYKVFSGASETSTAVQNLFIKLTNPEEWLSYSQQSEYATQRAEDLLANLSRTCSVYEAEYQITDAITKGKLALTGARIAEARWEAKEISLSREINEQARKLKENHPGITEWKTSGSNPLVLQNLEPNYSKWVEANNRFEGAQRGVKSIEEQLKKIGTLCNRLGEMASIINERVKTYLDLSTKGYNAALECKFQNAEDVLEQLKKLENSECGHYLPKRIGPALGSKESEVLAAKIELCKESEKCKEKDKTPKNLTERYIGTFTISPGIWTPTAVLVKKGQNFRVEYDPKTGGKWRYTEGTKEEFGPEGGGYWKWFKLKGKIGELLTDIDFTYNYGTGYAQQEGILELGAPATYKMGHSDEKYLAGSYTVKLYVKDAAQTQPNKTTNYDKPVNNDQTTNTQPSSNEKIEKAKKDLDFLKRIANGEMPQNSSLDNMMLGIKYVMSQYKLFYSPLSTANDCEAAIRRYLEYIIANGIPSAQEKYQFDDCINPLIKDLEYKINNNQIY